MTIAIGNDHAGYALKVKLMEMLKDKYEFTDYGCYSTERYDYPDAAEAVANAIVAGKHERGILICGSGIGISIAANKVPGIRAVCTTTQTFCAWASASPDLVKRQRWLRSGSRASWKAAVIWVASRKSTRSRPSTASKTTPDKLKELRTYGTDSCYGSPADPA